MGSDTNILAGKKLPNCVRNLLTKFDDVNDSLLSRINNGVLLSKKSTGGSGAIRVIVPTAHPEAEDFEDGDDLSLMCGGVETTRVFLYLLFKKKRL